MDIKAFWRAVLAQDEPEIRAYFAPDAYVNWHCTNEHFTVDEFITANCEYPGEWDGVDGTDRDAGRPYRYGHACLSEGSELLVPCDVLPSDGKRQDRVTG